MSLYDSILITGGGGMLAWALKRELDRRGLSYAAPDRAALDIADDASVANYFEEHRPTLVLNTAAYTKVDLAEAEPAQADRVNGDGAGRLAAAAARAGAKLVHYSTDFVFDGSLRRPYRADDATGPLSAYGRSKLLGERRVRETAGLDWAIVRTAWLYGPGGPCFPQTMLSLARQGVPLRVVADQVGAPTFTGDLAAATLDLLDRGAAGVWHLTDAGQTTWFDFTRAVLEAFGAPAAALTPITAADWKAARPASAVRPLYSVLDLEPFARLVGRPMPAWEQGLTAYRRLV